MNETKLADAAKALVEACDKSIYMNDYCGLEVSKHDATQVNAAIEALREALEAKPAPDSAHAFKNFHRRLCERFGYTHDERHWWRDLVSLEEWIAKQEAKPAPAHVPEADFGNIKPLTDEQIDALAEPFIRELGGGTWHSGDLGVRDDSDLIEFVRAIETAHGIAASKGGAE